MSAPDRLPGWIQRADLSAVDFDPVTFGEACRLLSDHDWKAEVEWRSEREDKGEESCPPGIAFSRTVPDGMVLFHACPKDGGLWVVHYHYPEGHRRSLLAAWFGLRRRDLILQRIRTARDLWPARVREALSAFFFGDRDAVLDVLEGERA